MAWLYLLTLYFQEVLGYGPLAAGLLFLPMALASVAASAVAGRLATNLGTARTAALGLGGVAAGLLLMMAVSREGGLLVVLAGTVVGEAGFMFSTVSLTIAGTGATGEDGRGLAAGLLNTSVQLGNAWGLGVAATLVAAAAGPLAGGRPARRRPGGKAPRMHGLRPPGHPDSALRPSRDQGQTFLGPRRRRVARGGPTPRACRTRRRPASRR